MVFVVLKFDVGRFCAVFRDFVCIYAFSDCDFVVVGDIAAFQYVGLETK